MEEKENLPDKLPKPWYWSKESLMEQLNRELPPKHILVGKRLKTIARRQDQDDALFEIINDPEYKYAIVHLTWAQNTLKDSYYPRTNLYKNWEDVYNERILDDAKDFEESDV